MPPSDRAAFLETNRRLNDAIALLSEALREGSVTEERLRDARTAAREGIASLGSIAEGGDALAADAKRVVHHVELLSQAADDANAAPVLAGRLLDHLLEEQHEIHARVAGAGLPGDRPPLTVGSLIGR